MTYTTFIVCIVIRTDSLKHINVSACDMAAAHADVRAAYGDDVEIVSTGWL